MKKYFFREWVHIKSDEDLKDAEQYLILWRRFLLRKLPECKFLEDRIGESAEYSDQYLKQPRRMYIKVCVECNDEIDLDSFPTPIGVTDAD